MIVAVMSNMQNRGTFESDRSKCEHCAIARLVKPPYWLWGHALELEACGKALEQVVSEEEQVVPQVFIVAQFR